MSMFQFSDIFKNRLTNTIVQVFVASKLGGSPGELVAVGGCERGLIQRTKERFWYWRRPYLPLLAKSDLLWPTVDLCQPSL